MDTLSKERDRLLRRSVSLIGSAFIVVSLLSFLSALGAARPPSWADAGGGELPVVPALALATLFILSFGICAACSKLGGRWWAIGGSATVIALILCVGQLPVMHDHAPGIIIPLGGGGLAGFVVLMLASRVSVAVAAVTGAFGLVAATALVGPENAVRAIVVMSVSWLVVLFHYRWLSVTIPRAARRIYSIGRAHGVERRASEAEAQRRQSARLLHDTVLATLTLLAHSGVGVSPDALRHQAADDAHLLRQLRLGAIPSPSRSGQYTLEPVDETPLGTTLESVKQRFGRLGLEVSWHGTGQVLLPSEVLDAFLLALAECLENVRRHSGVTEAHVTISVDDTTVRAMVTDAGIGFAIDDVDQARLGLRESVIGRLGEVGGTARMFSAIGAGTTVVLEVPRS